MSASRTFAIVSSVAMLALGVALLRAQQQPHAVIDPVRTLEARYEVATPWWDPARRTSLAASKDFDNPSGKLRLLNQSGEVQTKDHAFFTPLGSNGRSCITCHQPTSAMSLSVELIRIRWAETDGKDPLFAAIDGSNCPGLPQDKEESHSLLLERGLFRIALPWPPVTAVKPDFRIEVVRDPTGCNKNSASISVYRRPRVAANLRYVALPTGITLMADGRDPSLQSQAISAALIHEQASAAPTPTQLQQIEDFERQLFVAQQWDTFGGQLGEPGGPPLLGADNLASGVAGSGAVPAAGNLAASFDPWRDLSAPGLAVRQRAFRESALRGVDLFASREFRLADGRQVTCATCHHSGINRGFANVFADIGTTNLGTTSLPGAKESPELPLFRITCNASAPPHPQMGRTFLTQDPGRALITGRCADVGSILMQQFRGLTARAPYFANGSAGDLTELVDFYDRRFKIGLTDKEKQDLANFLSIL